MAKYKHDLSLAFRPLTTLTGGALEADLKENIAC